MVKRSEAGMRKFALNALKLWASIVLIAIALAPILRGFFG